MRIPVPAASQVLRMAMTSRAGFSLDFLSLTCFTAHSPMRVKGVGRREASPKPFPSDFAPGKSSPAGLLALGSSAGLRLPDGVVSTSDWLSPCNRRPRLQRRDRHGFAPCSGILDDVRMLATRRRVKQPWTGLRTGDPAQDLPIVSRAKKRFSCFSPRLCILDFSLSLPKSSTRDPLQNSQSTSLECVRKSAKRFSDKTYDKTKT